METWNVMIYLAGDNNLSEEMVWSLKELRKVKIANSIVSAQLDPLVTRIGSQRYLFTPKGTHKPWEVQTDRNDDDVKKFVAALSENEIPVKDNLDLTNTGNPLALLYFIWLALRECKHRRPKPTRHMLILAGHGAGFEGDFLTDDTSRDSLTMLELSTALNDAIKLIGRKIDILGMDSCLMSTAEVFYQVHNAVDYLVAAEGFEANSGWPYHDFLAQDLGDPETAASKIVESYVLNYLEYASRAGQSVDLSACKVVYADDAESPQLILTEPIKRLARALLSALYHPRYADAIILAHWRAQTYKSDQYVDLRDFAASVIKEFKKIGAKEARRCRVPDECAAEKKTELCKSMEDAIEKSDQIRRKVIETCSAVIKIIDKVVINSGYVGPDYQHSNGFSVYLPWSHVSKEYENLNFAKKTKWKDFLDKYTELTRCSIRIPRFGWTPASRLAVKCGIREPEKKGRVTEPYKRASEPYKRASEPYKRASEPYKRASEPYKRGQLICISMKNPPHEWLPCDILRRLDQLHQLPLVTSGAGS